MNPFDKQFEDLLKIRPGTTKQQLSSGGYLLEIPYRLRPGWNRTEVKILFLAPPGYPGAQPDCFWVEPTEPGPIRLENGSTPQATNDTNPIPGVGPRGTWFSWHVQKWNPNKDSLCAYFRIVETRLWPPR
jgi:E2/UBC family protein E